MRVQVSSMLNCSGVLMLNRSRDWLPNIRHCRSPFFNQRPSDELSLVVLHNISLPPDEFGGGYIDQLFLGKLNPREHSYFAEIAGLEVSAHLLIERAGQVTQYVGLMDRAWHAGHSEFLGRANCNNFSVGIELEGSDHQPFTAAQYEQLALVIRSMWSLYPQMEKWITGHQDIAPRRKTDPGPFFDWKHLKALLPEARIMRRSADIWAEEL